MRTIRSKSSRNPRRANPRNNHPRTTTTHRTQRMPAQRSSSPSHYCQPLLTFDNHTAQPNSPPPRPKNKSKTKSKLYSGKSPRLQLSCPSSTGTARSTFWSTRTQTPRCPWNGVTATQRRLRTGRRCSCGASVQRAIGLIRWLVIALLIEEYIGRRMSGERVRFAALLGEVGAWGMR